MAQQKETISAGKMWVFIGIAIAVIGLLMTIAMSVVFNSNGERAVSNCEKGGGIAQVEKSKLLFITTAYKVECEK
jgi:Na+/H+-translocating membrane pyrophosphatase